jgi:hypothetical protein
MRQIQGMMNAKYIKSPSDGISSEPQAQPTIMDRSFLPLPNYSLSTTCPACGHATSRRACKVRCERCGFMWDCSEL